MCNSGPLYCRSTGETVLNRRETIIRAQEEMPLRGLGIWNATFRTPPVLLAWTLGRLALIPIIVAAFALSPLLTAITLAGFVVADLYDGVLARQLHADDPSRRVLDSAVDRISIWIVYIAVTLAGYLPAVLLILFLARDLYCGVWCYRMIRSRNVAIRADWLYRSLNLMLAGWVIAAPVLSSSGRSVLFVVVLVFSLVVACDLRRCIGRVLNAPISVHDVVLPASDLRVS
jgi:phosphatidylglycerophosphate synthase